MNSIANDFEVSNQRISQIIQNIRKRGLAYEVIIWQEAYMNRLNQQYPELLSSAGDPSVKF